MVNQFGSGSTLPNFFIFYHVRKRLTEKITNIFEYIPIKTEIVQILMYVILFSCDKILLTSE